MTPRWQLASTALIAIAAFFSIAGAQQNAQSPSQQAQRDDDRAVIKEDVNVVSIYFTVRDAHKRLVPDLTQSQFRVTEDGREQQIKFFAHHSNVPLNVGILLDTGTSMGRTLGMEADASTLFFQHVLRPTDLGFVVSYAAHIETLQGPTSDIRMLDEQVQSIRKQATIYSAGADPNRTVMGPLGGGMPLPQPQVRRDAHLYDAIRTSTFRYLKREVGRKAMVIVALSDDARSESTLEDALDALLQSDVVAYVFQIYDVETASHRDYCDVAHIYERDATGEYKLKKLAEATGGRVIEVRGVDRLASAFDEISEELHNQYSLGYYPANTNWDGKYRKIAIESRAGGYKIFARRGYYGNPPGQR